MLRFHRAHGRNIELTENRRTAIRVESFANALVFSHRPLERNELFLIEIQDQAIGWAGNIRCGITLHNPGSIQIPQYLFPDLQKMGKSYVFALKPVIDDPFNDMETNMKIVNWNNRTLCAERNGNKNVETVIRRCEKMKYCDKFNKKLLALDPLCNPCGINSRIGFFVSPKGELYFLINGQQFGPCVQNIPTRSNIYAVVDLYGATKQVQILNCGVPSLSMFCKNLLWQSYTEEELDDELQEACLPKTLKMELKEFYASHGS